MPQKRTIERVRRDKREGKAARAKTSAKRSRATGAGAKAKSGRKWSAERKRVLNQAKVELRKAFHREPARQ